MTTKKDQAATFLSTSPLTGSALVSGLASELGITVNTSKVYISKWRKANGTQRTYKKRSKVEIGGE